MLPASHNNNASHSHTHSMQLNTNRLQASNPSHDSSGAFKEPEDKGPQCKPLNSMEELLNWHPGEDDYNVSNTPLHPRSYVQTDEPELKVIVCHDMAGGYVEDAATQGNDYSTIYSIQSWRYIDTFIYFSHARVTIPPPCWTNAAHRNGVKCLGTYITEWLPGIVETDQLVSGPGAALSTEPIGEPDDDDKDKGKNGRGGKYKPDKEENKREKGSQPQTIDELMAQPDKVDRRWFSKVFADKLVDIAVYYKFDGWLINIESILRGRQAQAKQMVAFLSYLRQQIHARIPGGELIWYDSVAYSTGELAWQDRLSVENYPFFEQSDGIFTNYTWKEDRVAESVKLAGNRRRDVYTGIDMWGRGTFGGGGFYSYKALEVIKREGTSAALFAPGYLYQNLGTEDFLVHDRLFWSGFSGAGIHAEGVNKVPKLPPPPPPPKPLKPPKQPEGGEGMVGADDEDYLPVAALVKGRPSGSKTWFYTDFDRGFGHKMFIGGEQVRDRQWSNLSRQSLPPNMANDVYVLRQDHQARSPSLDVCNNVRWMLSPDDAYNGGTSIMIEQFECAENHPSATADKAVVGGLTTVAIPLYETQVSLQESPAWTVELVYKRLFSGAELVIYLGINHNSEVQEARSNVIQDVVRWTPEGRRAAPPLLIAHGVKIGSGLTSATRLLALDVNACAAMGDVCTMQKLENGWHRMVVSLTGMLQHAGYSPPISHGSVLAQLGVTLTFPATSLAKGEGARPLALLGSLAVLPLHTPLPSALFALRVSDTSVKIVKRPTSSSSLNRLENQQKQTSANAGDGHTYLQVWSTLSWDIGYATVLQDRLPNDNNNSIEEVSPAEYSHYNIYLSYEPCNGSARAPSTGTDAIYVGTAFTTKYRITGASIAVSSSVPKPSISPGGRLTGSIFQLVAWVQGVRRHGRLDPREEWISRELR